MFTFILCIEWTEEKREPIKYGGLGFLTGVAVVLGDTYLAKKPSLMVSNIGTSLYTMEYAIHNYFLYDGSNGIGQNLNVM